jgi:hypothetical protein
MALLPFHESVITMPENALAYQIQGSIVFLTPIIHS